MKKRSLNRKGFTMLEVIAVVVVLGILMVVLMPRLTSGTDKAKELGVNKEFKDFSDSIETIFTENSRLPGATDITASKNAVFVAKFNTYIDDYFKIHVANATANAESLNLTATAAVTADLGGHYATDAEDPFGAKYGVITSRDSGTTSGILEKVLVYSRGKSLTTNKADYLTLAVYKDGKITKCNAGFKGDIQKIVIDTNGNDVADTAEIALGFSEDDTAAVQTIGTASTDGINLPNHVAVAAYLTEASIRTMICVNK